MIFQITKMFQEGGYNPSNMMDHYTPFDTGLAFQNTTDNSRNNTSDKQTMIYKTVNQTIHAPRGLVAQKSAAQAANHALNSMAKNSRDR